MEILNFVFEFIYVSFIAVCMLGAAVMLYDYFQERKLRKYEKEEKYAVCGYRKNNESFL